MKHYAFVLALGIAGIAWICGSDSAQETDSKKSEDEVFQEMEPPPVPGYKWVRQIRYQEIRHPYCKEVPDKRSRWVYSCKPDYYCIPRCPIHGLHHQKGCAECAACQSCKGPYQRCQLMKKRVEWEYGTKCVVDFVKEKKPYVVWRKVRLGAKDSERKQTPETLPPPRQEGGVSQKPSAD